MISKDKSLKQLPRFCKWCKTLLPKDCHHQKKFCPNTNHGYLYNQKAGQERRDKIRATKKPKIKICRWKDCDAPFEIQFGKELQAYCSDECRLKKQREGQRIYAAKINARKEKRVIANIFKEEEVKEDGRLNMQDIYINPYWKERGRIHYEGLSL